jgi:hypothetical protein
MSWECRHRSGDECVKLDATCDPGRTGCVLRGRVYFPFAPHKNPAAMNDAAAHQPPPKPQSRRRGPVSDAKGP